MIPTLKVVVFFGAVIIVFAINHTTARPGQAAEYEFSENKCDNDGNSEIIEVCQRCAKQTKSNIVYPMCCKNTDDAYNWCYRYVWYGKQS